MLLSKKLIVQFQALHLEKFGDMISHATAELQLKELAELIRLTSAKESEVGNA